MMLYLLFHSLKQTKNASGKQLDTQMWKKPVFLKRKNES